MQKIVLSVTILVIMTSCNYEQKAKESRIDANKALYEQAKGLEDEATAIVALNYLLLEDSTNLEYMDSLSRLYIRNGVLTSGLALGHKVMKVQPDNFKTLELIAEAQMALGKYPEAIVNLEKLHKEIGDVRYIYQLAIIDSEMKNAEKFDARLDQILIDPGTATVEFPAVQGMQQVDIKAAANFLKAQLHYNSGNMDQALSYVKKALTISPNFQSALVAFEQIQKGTGGAPTGQSRKLSAKEMEDLRYKQYMEQQSRGGQ